MSSTDELAMSNSPDLQTDTATAGGFGAFKPSALFSLALLVLLGLYWFPLLSGATSFYVSDHTYYFEPLSKYIGEAFREFRLPLWNPYLYCGMSQLAVPSPGIFYPGSLLFAIGSYSQAIAGQMLLHQLLAGFGMFILVSSFGWGRAPAAVAALIASMTGYMFSLTTNCTLAFSASCLPLSLWAFRSIGLATYKGNKTARYWCMSVAVVTVYLLIAAGRPEVFAPGCGMIAGYCILEGVLRNRRGEELSEVFAAWRWQVLAVCTGIALAMPVLLPVAEWAALSPRAKGLSASHALMWSINWYDLACMMYPQPFGDLLVLGTKYLHIVATRPTFYPYITSLFIGPVSVTLAIWGFFDRTWAWRKWLLLTLVGFLIFCLGEYTPVAPFMVRTFSSFSVLRYPVKMMIFPILLLAIAAARGAKTLLNDPPSRPGQRTSLIFWSVSVAVGIAFFAAGASNVTFPAKNAMPAFAEFALGRSMIGSSLIGLLCCLGAHLYHSTKLTRQQIAYVLMLGLAANLTTVAFCNKQMTTKTEFFKQGQTVDSWLTELEKSGAPHGRVLNLYFDPLFVPPDYTNPAGNNWTSNFFAYSRQLLLCNTCIDSHRSETFGYEASETNNYRTMVLSAVRDSLIDSKSKELPVGPMLDLPVLRLCQSTNTKWVTSQIHKAKFNLRVLNPDYFEVQKEDFKLNLRLYKVRGAAPRCYFAENWKWVDEPKDVATKLKKDALRFAPLSVPEVYRNSGKAVPRSLNVLGPELPPAPPDGPAIPEDLMSDVRIDRLDRSIHPEEIYPDPRRIAIQSPNSNATMMLDKPEHVSITVVNKKPGFLILCDHFYPGWCATVDSVQVPVWKANLEMRAVYLPVGTHLVEFDFRSDSLKNGLMIASGGLFLLLSYLLLAAAPAIWRFVKSTAGQ